MSRVVKFPKEKQAEVFDPSEYENPVNKLAEAMSDETCPELVRARKIINLCNSKPYLPFKHHPAMDDPSLRAGECRASTLSILNFVETLAKRELIDKCPELVEEMMSDVYSAATQGLSFVGYEEGFIDYMSYIGERERPTQEEFDACD